MSDGASASKKRQTGAGSRSEGPHQKRNKINSARSIPTQPADVALKDGELDLQAFVAAHEFEIRSLEQSMATSKAVSATRAFQHVPRGLRRRTASHNPKRVPRRLRARAKKEMAEDNTPLVESRRRGPRTTRARIRAETAKRLRILATRKEKKRLRKKNETGKESDDVTMKDVSGDAATTTAGVVGRTPRPKIRRDVPNEPPKPASKFRRRQVNKTWLPTHTWHAKRARMTEPRSPLWGFAIPMTPNEKIYRPTHRAQGNRGAIAWDTSYFSTIRLFGHYAGMERVLRKLGVNKEACWNQKGLKWRNGTKSWTGLLSRNLKTGIRDVATAMVLWNPVATAKEDATTQDEGKVERQAFIRVHPSAFSEVFAELVRLTKMQTPRLHVEDLRFEIGSVELTGPASTEVLHAVLTPFPSASGADANHIRLFRGIRGLTNPASLPANAVLGFHIQDPRLRYPPRKDDTGATSPSQDDLLETLSKWPVNEGLCPYALFDRKARRAASGLPSQKHINRRRAAGLPGTQLKPGHSDPKIPILLLATRESSDMQIQGTWTLMAPWFCIQHLWHSIVRCPITSGGNLKFGGVNELRQVAFERGQPWFPGDFIATNSGLEWELAERERRRRDWERRPKSKRTAWESLDLGGGRKGEVGDGLACDFESLFGMSQTRTADTVDAAKGGEDSMMDVDEETDGGVDVALSARNSLRDLSAMSKADFIRLSTKESSTVAPQNTIITTRITMCGSGVAKSRARVYRLPSTPVPTPISSNAEVPASMPPTSKNSTLPPDLRAKWLALAARPKRNSSLPKAKPLEKMDLEARKRLLAQELVAPPENANGKLLYTLDPEGHHLLVPDNEDLIGFVTSGSFSLSEGHGMAIASLAVDKVLSDVRQSAKEGHYCIVRNAGESVGWLARWEIL